MILYYDEQGNLKMMSETRVQTTLEFIEKDLTIKEIENIKDINWDKKIKEEKLTFEKSKYLQEKEDKISKVDKAKTITDLKEILKEII